MRILKKKILRFFYDNGLLRYNRLEFERKWHYGVPGTDCAAEFCQAFFEIF